MPESRRVLVFPQSGALREERVGQMSSEEVVWREVEEFDELRDGDGQPAWGSDY